MKKSTCSVEKIEGEVWKDIPSLLGYYEASNLGRIKSKRREVKNKKGKSYMKPENILSPNNNGNGYFSVMLSINGNKFRRYIHRLVIEAFTGASDCENVDHINGIKSDNSIDNLRCCTARQNTIEYQKRNKNKSCKSVGVSFYKGLNKFGASITIQKDSYSLGTFDTEEEASDFYQKTLHNWEVFGIKPREKQVTGKRDSKLKGIYLDKHNKYSVFKYYNYKQYYLKSFLTIEEALVNRDRLYNIIPKELSEELLKFIIKEYKNKYLND